MAPRKKKVVEEISLLDEVSIMIENTHVSTNEFIPHWVMSHEDGIVKTYNGLNQFADDYTFPISEVEAVSTRPNLTYRGWTIKYVEV